LKERECANCHELFSEKKSKKGKIIHCDICSEEIGDILPPLGFNNGAVNKGVEIEVYKGNDPRIRAKISNQRNRTGGF
jgi:hypothetical protein